MSNELSSARTKTSWIWVWRCLSCCPGIAEQSVDLSKQARKLNGLGVVIVATRSERAIAIDESQRPFTVAGTWTGNFRIAACTDTLNGAPGTLCTSLTGATAPRQPITLALQQTDDKVVGNIQFTGWYIRSLVVTGIVQPGGAVILEGTTTWTEPVCATAITPVPGRLTLTLWNTLVNRTSDGMSGDFRLRDAAACYRGPAFPGLEDDEKRAKRRLELEAEYEAVHLSPTTAAERGYIDEVIDPIHTRLAVAGALAARLGSLPRRAVAAASLSRWGALCVTADLAHALEVANALAPERLELCLADPWARLEAVRNAGAIVLERRGQLGTFLRGQDLGLLWENAEGGPFVVALPLARTHRYEGLATALKTQLMTVGVETFLMFVAGSQRRIQALRSGSCTVVVMSALAADESLRSAGDPREIKRVEAADVVVSCEACERRRSMAQAFGPDNEQHLPACRGRRPHLRDFAPEGCDVEHVRAMLEPGFRHDDRAHRVGHQLGRKREPVPQGIGRDPVIDHHRKDHHPNRLRDGVPVCRGHLRPGVRPADDPRVPEPAGQVPLVHASIVSGPVAARKERGELFGRSDSGPVRSGRMGNRVAAGGVCSGERKHPPGKPA